MEFFTKVISAKFVLIVLSVVLVTVVMGFVFMQGADSVETSKFFSKTLAEITVGEAVLVLFVFGIFFGK